MTDTETVAPAASLPSHWDWRSKLRWFAAEILIVISGVLIALALNSWWSEREDRRFERDLRADIIAEFETNLSDLEADLSHNDSTYALISFLNTLSDSALFALSSEDLTIRFRDVIDVAGFDPEVGIVQAVVESGSISVVSDRDLRVLLSRWAGLLEEKRRFSLQVFEYANQNLFPMAAQASADLEWTDVERRELQTAYRTYSFFHQLVIENQQDLRATALEILTYLERQK